MVIAYVSVVLGGFLFGSLLYGILRSLRQNNELLAIDRHRPDTTEELSRLSDAVTSNYDEIQNLRLAVDEGIRSVARAEKRVAKSIQSARRLVAEHGLEHPGVEAEAAELRDRDGEPSEEETLPAVSPDMEEDLFVETGIPGYDGRG